MLLNKQPIWLGGIRRPPPHADQHPVPLQLCSVKREFQIAFLQPFLNVPMRLPCAAIPKHHRAAAVLSLRNDSFKVSVLQRMVFHLHGEALVSRKVTRPLGHSPALEDSTPAQAKVVMQSGRRMFLNHEG